MPFTPANASWPAFRGSRRPCPQSKLGGSCARRSPPTAPPRSARQPRRRVVGHLRRIQVKLDPAHAPWRRASAPNLRRVVVKFHAPLLEYIIRATGRPDADPARVVTRRLLLLGCAPMSGSLLGRSTLASIPLTCRRVARCSWAGQPATHRAPERACLEGTCPQGTRPKLTARHNAPVDIGR